MKLIKKNDNRGTTLAEMIITFALLGIFLAAAATIISSAVIMYSELTTTMYAQSVSEILLDKVTGELAAQAERGQTLMLGDTQKMGGTLGNGALFYDKDNHQMICLIKDGLLTFVGGQTDDWILDEKAYMGYRISDFGIHKINDKNVLEVSIKIKNLKTGFEYSASKCTACYNFDTEAAYTRIVESEIPLQN